MHRLLCLGQLSLVDAGGQPVTHAAAQPRRLALLALLGRSAPRAVSRERLIGWFWRDADEERGRRSLNQALYALRTELGAEDVLLGQRDLRLNLELLSCDVADFEHAIESGRLEDAVALYRGPFADGFHLPSAPEFEQWLEDERRAVALRYSEALESLASAAEAREEAVAAVGWWRKAANADPSSAPLAIRLMRALAAAGDRAGAVRHATIYETIVRQQFELPPDPGVLALAEELKRAPVASAAPPPPRSAGPESPAPPALQPAAPSPAPEQPPAPSLQSPVASRPSRPFPWRRLAAWSAAPLLVAAAGLLVWRSGRATDEGGDGPPVVAVVPLENATGDSTYNLLGAMVTDWVTQCLAETGLVRVMDTRTMLAASRQNIRTLYGETGARYAVLGTIYLRGDSLEFRTAITDTRSGLVVSTIEPVVAASREPTQALTGLEERVTGALAVQVDRRLSNYTASASQPPTWIAYQEFLLGLRDFGRDYEANLAHFSRASQLDTAYWQARLWAGNTMANLRRYPQSDSAFQTLEARRDQLAPYDRATLDYFYGGFVRGDWETSYRGAQAMATLAPLAPHALWALGLTARITGRWRQAIDVLGRVNLNHGWGVLWTPRVLGEIARARHHLGEHETELEVTRRMVQRVPDDGFARTQEVIALAALRRYGVLASRIEAAVTLPEDPTTWDDFSPGDLLIQVARELQAHGAPPDTVTRYARAAVQWYAPLTAAGESDTVHLLGHARAEYTMGNWAAALDLYERLLTRNPESAEYRAGAATAALRLGDTVRAQAALLELTSIRRPYQFGRPSRWAASIAAVMGRPEEAVRLLTQARRDGFARFYEWHTHPDLQPLQRYGPFRELLSPTR